MSTAGTRKRKLQTYTLVPVTAQELGVVADPAVRLGG